MEQPKYVYIVYIPYSRATEGPIIGNPCLSKEAAAEEVLRLLSIEDTETVITERRHHRGEEVAQLPVKEVESNEADIAATREKLIEAELADELVNHPPTTTKEAKQ
jgi:hypothetical protein